MSEEVNQNVGEVVQPTETEQVQEVAEKHLESSQEYNWKAARQQLSEAQRRIQELEYRLQSQQAPVAEERDELEGISKDDYLTRGQAEALALRKAQELLQQQEQATAEDRVRLKFKDYDDVVTDDNLKELIENDEDVWNSLKASPNPYAAAYKLIKKSAFYSEKSKKRNPDAEKIVKNAQKPVSSNAVQARPLASANAYATNQAERKALYEEMMGYASRR